MRWYSFVHNFHNSDEHKWKEALKQQFELMSWDCVTKRSQVRTVKSTSSKCKIRLPNSQKKKKKDKAAYNGFDPSLDPVGQELCSKTRLPQYLDFWIDFYMVRKQSSKTSFSSPIAYFKQHELCILQRGLYHIYDAFDAPWRTRRVEQYNSTTSHSVYCSMISSKH